MSEFEQYDAGVRAGMVSGLGRIESEIVLTEKAQRGDATEWRDGYLCGLADAAGMLRALLSLHTGDPVVIPDIDRAGSS